MIFIDRVRTPKGVPNPVKDHELLSVPQAA